MRRIEIPTKSLNTTESAEKSSPQASSSSKHNQSPESNLLSPSDRRTSSEIMRISMNRNNLYMTVSQVNIMLTKMVFIIFIFSASEHLFLLLSHFTFPAYFGQIKLDIIFLANFSMLINNSFHLFVFYYFNKFFKMHLKRFLSIKH